MAAVPIEQFVESMLSWATPMVKRRARWRGDHVILSHDDLLQEAKLVLVEVWNDYAGKIPEIEMRKIGTRAVHFHLGNIWYATESKRSKVHCDLPPDVRYFGKWYCTAHDPIRGFRPKHPRRMRVPEGKVCE